MSPIKISFSEGKTDAALEQLLDMIHFQAPKWEKTALLLLASFSHLEQQIAQNVISEEAATLQRNQINAAGLRVLEQIEAGVEEPASLYEELQQEFLNPSVSRILKEDNDNITDLEDVEINVDEDAEVVIGSGNTVNKRILKGFAWWQFGLVIALLGGIAYIIFSGFGNLNKGQEEIADSFQSMKAELLELAKQEGVAFKEQIPELENQIERIATEMKAKEYKKAIRDLEALAKKAPIAGVYKNLAYAYEEDGKIEAAYKTRLKAIKMDAFPEKSLVELKGKRLNLNFPGNGTRMLVSEDPNMANLVDNDLGTWHAKNWLVLGFKEDATALLDQVDVYIPDVKRTTIMKVSIGNDTPTGDFEEVGEFEFFNGYIVDQPFQEFKFEPVKAKYIKIEFVELGRAIFELRVWGTLQG